MLRIKQSVFNENNMTNDQSNSRGAGDGALCAPSPAPNS
jgi:hypothetical protein